MSEHVTGFERDQVMLFPDTLDAYVDEENAVRFIDAFVDGLDLKKLGFKRVEPEETGRPSYDPSDLLKLYVYGYLNQVRTSRKLGRECCRNVELMWLMKKLTPDFRTIADFRKDNVDCIKLVFKEFVKLCRSLDLIGGELVGVDGVKLKAVNSKSRNFNQAKLEYRIRRLDLHIAEYLNELEENDRKQEEERGGDHHGRRAADAVVAVTASSQSGTVDEAREYAMSEIEKLESTKRLYERMQETLKESGQSEISLTDPESRLMKNNEKLEVCYSAQVAVDSKHHLIPEYYVTNEAVDSEQLARISKAAKDSLGVGRLKVTADMGFFNWQEIKNCLDDGITPYVPEIDRQSSHGFRRSVPEPDFYKGRFTYDGGADTYVCPTGKRLEFRRWNTDHTGKRNKMYWPDPGVCEVCPLRQRCTTGKRGRIVVRWEHEEVIEELRKRNKTIEGLMLLKKRKELCEHPFGTLKRAFNQGYLLLKGLRKVNGEVGFTMLAYNMRRAINILGSRVLTASLSMRTIKIDRPVI
jgi:transposase